MNLRSAVEGEARRKGLQDESARYRALRFQGPRVFSWLTGQGFACPEALFGVERHAEGGEEILVAKVGRQDGVLQGSADSFRLRDLDRAPRPADGVFQVPEESATFRLSDPQADGVWRQSCAVRLDARPADVVVYTRVAGISCAVIPEEQAGPRSYRVWVDYSYALDLWRSLVEILSA